MSSAPTLLDSLNNFDCLEDADDLEDTQNFYDAEQLSSATHAECARLLHTNLGSKKKVSSDYKSEGKSEIFVCRFRYFRSPINSRR